MSYNNRKTSLVGGFVALVIATSCCWLPFVVIGIAGASGWAACTDTLGQNGPFFLLIALALSTYGGYMLWQRSITQKGQKSVVLESILTCPSCNHRTVETMPTAACQFFYECINCNTILKPNKGDCCVYCSFGTVPCPPIQLNQDCC